MFAHYIERLKSALDTAVTTQLSQLLGDIRIQHPREALKLLTGGKKIRGSLLCLATEILGGSVNNALPRVVAIEFIQTATLIHDDFVDQHRARRNLPATWTLEGARRAVLLGDILFSAAIQMMSEKGPEDCRIVSRAIAEISRGAYQEPLSPSVLQEEIAANRVDAALYEKIISLKTGILFGAACELGAVAASTTARLQQAWHRYGMNIGEAYQIADDLQDIEQNLLTRTITASEMTALAPALLFFVKESRPHILAALRQESMSLQGKLLECFQATAESMKVEREARLRAAVTVIEKDFPDNDQNRLAHQAPWDLIRMFDTARLPVSLPSR